ncbi:MAG: ATP-dependent helicase [Salinisphaeraceae bacterium]
MSPQHLLAGLNPDQEAAVLAASHCVVVACPGSGKTRVLQTRAAYLLGSNPEARVVAVTFTKDAARELRQRTLDSLSDDAADRVAVATFHSLAKHQLEKAGMRLRLIDPAAQSALIERARDMAAPEMDDQTAGETIEKLKSTLQPNPLNDREAGLYEMYTKLLNKHGMIDFADLLLFAVRGLQDGTVPPLPCTHILVDEFQDADDVQHLWISAHIKAGAIATVVGDDDQSLYSWRRARGYEGMSTFRDNNHARLITLSINYRCRAEILDHAGHLIRQNPERIDKDMQAGAGPGAIIERYRFEDAKVEAAAVSETVAADPEGWAVIARTNSVIDHIQRQLQSDQIDHRRIGGSDLWSAPPNRAYLALLDSVVTGRPLGAEQALQWANIGAHTIDRLHESGLLAARRRRPPQPGEINDEKVETLVAALPRWRSQHANGRHGSVATSVSEWVLGQISGASKRAQRQRELFQMTAQSFIDMDGSLAQRMDYLSRRKKKMDASVPTLLTMHSSKGLEFDKVWIVRAEEGVVPHKNNHEMDEERRLFFVAMTRAKARLVVSSAAPGEVSRFIDESRLHLINTESERFIA